MGYQQLPDWSNWANWSKTWSECHEISKDTVEQIVRECISYYSDCTANVVKYMQTMPRVTSPEDFISTQMKAFSQQGEKNIEFAQNIFKIWQDSAKSNVNWAEQNVTSVVKGSTKGFKKAAENE